MTTDFGSFERLTSVCVGTRFTLRLAIAHGDIDEIGRGFIYDESLPVVEQMKSGIHHTCRSEWLDRSEAQALVRHIGIIGEDDESPAVSAASQLERTLLARMGRSGAPSSEDPALLESAAYARVILGLIPRLPSVAVTWPFRLGNYIDLQPPDRFGDLIARIEDLDRTLWTAAAGRRCDLEHLRRTYAFFDAASFMLDTAHTGFLASLL